MSSLSSAVTAQYVAEVQGSTTDLSCGLATTALLLYDVLLTSGKEYQYVWRSQKSWFSRVLYVWNRYITLLYLVINLGTIPSISNTMPMLNHLLHALSDARPTASCASIGWLVTTLQILSPIGPAMFTTLRIYALSRKNKILSVVALGLSIAPFVINASTVYTLPPINLPVPLNCTSTDTASRSLNIGVLTRQYGRLIIAVRGSLILVDLLAAAVTWHQTHTTIQLRTGTLKRPSLEQVMWENGTIYLCTLVSMNVVDMVLVLLSIAIEPDEASSYVLPFVDPISSILNSRFLLALHETNARLEGVVDASISSLTLNTGSGDDAQAGSPELLGFLGIVGGSICSFHDEDNNLRSLEFAPPQEEHQSEPEGEIQQIRTDTGNMA